MAVSNRLPHIPASQLADRGRGHPVGGLVSALWPALEARHGLWFGWSGHKAPAPGPARVQKLGKLTLVSLDLSEEELARYYNGFCNRTLWPLLHSFPCRVVRHEQEWHTYRAVNARFADSLERVLRKDDTVWIHDYHLLPLGARLRERGFLGPVGFFLHTPFPPAETFSILPRASQLLRGMSAYSLVGFHTERYAHNFVEAMQQEANAGAAGRGLQVGTNRTRVGIYPIGSEPEHFAALARSRPPPRRAHRSVEKTGAEKILIAVDRLDYTKGIEARLRAFSQLLERRPEWRHRVSLLQISAPSRTRVPEYLAHKNEVERLVGEINGRQGETDWSPIHYLYRSYDQSELAHFMREADACLVTPLNDGMNLVAKEFVACQDDVDPGVLVLSRFCGAAEELRDALLVNPYDVESTADAIARALEMPLHERQARWKSLWARCTVNTATTWRDAFLRDLGAA